MIGPFDWIKIGVGGIVGALIVAGPVYLAGRGDGRDAARLEAAQEAAERITNLEKNNANFRKLSDRDRCLVFMRDSGLPDSACD
ncbi:hypothetical protein [Rhizobium arsenicireducens]